MDKEMTRAPTPTEEVKATWKSLAEVKRYDFCQMYNNGLVLIGNCMDERPNGEYVKFTDYAECLRDSKLWSANWLANRENAAQWWEAASPYATPTALKEALKNAESAEAALREAQRERDLLQSAIDQWTTSTEKGPMPNPALQLAEGLLREALTALSKNFTWAELCERIQNYLDSREGKK